MFWNSILGGIYGLSYSQFWMAAALYAIVMFAFLLITSIASESKYSSICVTSHILFLVGGTILQGIMMSLLVAYLTPFLFLGSSESSINWIFLNIESIIKIGVISIVIVIVLGIVPIIGSIIASSPGIQTFLHGVIIFRLLSEVTVNQLLSEAGVQADIYPGFWDSIGFLIIAGIFTRVAFMLGFLSFSFIFSKLMPSKSSKSVEPVIGFILTPIVMLSGLLPVLMYISYVRLSLIQMLS